MGPLDVGCRRDRAVTTRRTLIVGTGSIAAAHAAAIASQGERAAAVARVDLEPTRARDFATRHGIDYRSADLAPALRQTWPDGGRLHRAHICTPHGSHVPLAVQCLRAAVPVYLGKPSALSLSLIDELLAVSQSTRVDLAVVFQHRFGSGARRKRTLLGGVAQPDQNIGRPPVATCHTLWYRDSDYFAVPWHGRWDLKDGRPTMAHGIHQFDLLLALLDSLAESTAPAGRQARDTDAQAVSIAVVRFDSEALATVVNSDVSPRQKSANRVDTQRATLKVDHLYGYTDADWTFTAAPDHEKLAAAWTTHDTAPRGSHAYQMAALLDAMNAREKLPVPLREARSILKLVAVVHASAFIGQVVRCGDIGTGHPFYGRMDGTGAPCAAATAREQARL